jgi:hypothetical protein
MVCHKMHNVYMSFKYKINMYMSKTRKRRGKKKGT